MYMYVHSDETVVRESTRLDYPLFACHPLPVQGLRDFISGILLARGSLDPQAACRRMYAHEATCVHPTTKIQHATRRRINGTSNSVRTLWTAIVPRLSFNRTKEISRRRATPSSLSFLSVCWRFKPYS